MREIEAHLQSRALQCILDRCAYKFSDGLKVATEATNIFKAAVRNGYIVGGERYLDGVIAATICLAGIGERSLHRGEVWGVTSLAMHLHVPPLTIKKRAAELLLVSQTEVRPEFVGWFPKADLRRVPLQFCPH